MPLVVSLVHGESLTRRRLCEELARYDLLVTFNSNSFDLPRPPCNDPRSPFGSASMDLCVLGRQLGYRGGLKAIEQQLRLSRRADLWGMNGAEAGQLRSRCEIFGMKRHDSDSWPITRWIVSTYSQLADLFYCLMVQQRRVMTRHANFAPGGQAEYTRIHSGVLSFPKIPRRALVIERCSRPKHAVHRFSL